MRTVSYNVLRVPEVWLLHLYYTRFWEPSVIRSRKPSDLKDAMDGCSFNL